MHWNNCLKSFSRGITSIAKRLGFVSFLKARNKNSVGFAVLSSFLCSRGRAPAFCLSVEPFGARCTSSSSVEWTTAVLKFVFADRSSVPHEGLWCISGAGAWLLSEGFVSSKHTEVLAASCSEAVWVLHRGAGVGAASAVPSREGPAFLLNWNRRAAIALHRSKELVRISGLCCHCGCIECVQGSNFCNFQLIKALNLWGSRNSLSPLSPFHFAL